MATTPASHVLAAAGVTAAHPKAGAEETPLTAELAVKAASAIVRSHHLPPAPQQNQSAPTVPAAVPQASCA